MWRRCFSSGRPVQLQKAHGEMMAKYYGLSAMEKSQRLAESVLPRFVWQLPAVVREKGRPGLGQVDPLWDRHSSGGSAVAASQQQLTRSSVLAGAGSASGGDNGLYHAGVRSLAVQTRISKTILLANNIYKQTGVQPRYITQRLEMKPLVLKRVSNQTAKGKIASHSALVVVGDRNGVVGLGEGKSRADMGRALAKAHWDAIRNVQHVERFEDRTVFRDVAYRYHGVKLFLRRRPRGFGTRTNHVIFEICQLAGIRDLSAKVYKSRNDMNVAKGFVEALTQGQRPLAEVAAGRGKRLVDVRKTYYS